MKTKLQKFFAKTALLGVVAMMLPQTSMAGALTDRTLVSDDHTKSSSASYKFTFDVAGGGLNAPSNTLTLTWPAGFDISSIAHGDVDLKEVGQSDQTIAASAGPAEWGFGVSGQVMTFTVLDTGATGITAGDTVEIEIGTGYASGASNEITNPSTAGSYNISIGGSFGDTGGFAVAIVDDSTVDVTATVTETITLALSATDLTFGTMSTGAEAFDSFTATVNTNADSGYTLRYTSTALANPNGTALASATTATATAAGTEGWGINGVLNSSPSVGGAKTETNGSGAVSAPYTTADSVAVTTTGAPSTFATSATTAEDEVYTVSGIANISAITEAGDYTGTMALLVQATF